MAIAEAEREAFGTELEPTDRAVAGLMAALGAVGHAMLAAAAATLVYVLATGV